MTQRNWRPEFERYRAAKDVLERLQRVPGVKRVSIGGRRRGGVYVPDMCFRVYVDKKLSESQLSHDQIIPRTIHGFSTDVLVERPTPTEKRGPNGENDTDNYSIKVGGIRIMDSRNRGQGTLGCFARRNSDNKPVALTCFHCFFPNKKDQGYSDAYMTQYLVDFPILVAQPKYKKSICCHSVIGQLVRVKDRPIDAAIVLLNPDVPFLDKVKRVPVPYDGTPPLNGVITGSADPTPNSPIWKVGSVTGLTRGTIEEWTDGQDIEIHFATTLDRFLDDGDSGSVVVDDTTRKVVGLLKAGADWSKGIAWAAATPIKLVESSLGIHIDGDSSLANANVSDSVEEIFDLPARSPFAAIAERVRKSRIAPLVEELVKEHEDELLELVNESRPGKVAWQRLQGPSYFAALARSAKEPSYRIPPDIAGISRAQAAAQLRAVLTTHGSDSLRAFVRQHGDGLEELLVRHDTLDAMMQAFDQQAIAVSDVDPRY